MSRFESQNVQPIQKVYQKHVSKDMLHPKIVKTAICICLMTTSK